MTLSAKSAFFVLFTAGLIDYCKKQKINEVNHCKAILVFGMLPPPPPSVGKLTPQALS